jgi:hypothetical protein
MGAHSSIFVKSERSGASGQNAAIVSPAAATAGFAQTIRLRCIRRRAPSLEQLAADSGVPLARLRKFLRDDDDARVPNLAEALSIWAVLGASAASASLAEIGMVAAEGEGEDPGLAEMVADSLDATSSLARMAIDGAIAPDEAASAEAAADQLQETATTLRRKARAARRR